MVLNKLPYHKPFFENGNFESIDLWTIEVNRQCYINLNIQRCKSILE